MGSYVVECPALGKLEKLKIRHDNSGGAAGWFLDKIVVAGVGDSRTYEFPCNRWLATDEDDNQISRVLGCSGCGGAFTHFSGVHLSQCRILSLIHI